jgi:hypothetical protein
MQGATTINSGKTLTTKTATPDKNNNTRATTKDRIPTTNRGTTSNASVTHTTSLLSNKTNTTETMIDLMAPTLEAVEDIEVKEVGEEKAAEDHISKKQEEEVEVEANITKEVVETTKEGTMGLSGTTTTKSAEMKKDSEKQSTRKLPRLSK